MPFRYVPWSTEKLIYERRSSFGRETAYLNTMSDVVTLVCSPDGEADDQTYIACLKDLEEIVAAAKKNGAE